MDVERDKFTEASGPGTAVGSIVIVNQGNAVATGIAVLGVYNDGTQFAVAASSGGDDLAVDPNGHLEIGLSFDWDSHKPEAGTFVIEDESGAGVPLTVPFTVREVVGGMVFAWAAFWSAFAALILIIISYIAVRKPGVGIPGLWDPVYPAASWSFSGSLASSLTAVGAILGTLVAASGFLGEVLPGLATGLFLGVNIGYLLVIALAGVAYKAAWKKANATYFALLFAASLTLWAVIGEITTLAQLVARGGLPSPWIVIAAIPIFVVLGLYSRASLLEVVLAEKPKETPSTIVVVVPCPDDTAQFAKTAALETITAQVSAPAVGGPTALL
jgi:hypothetical protein